jgi:acetyl-CoA synthetase
MQPAAVKRLLSPRSVALIGGAWADAAAAASRAIGYQGELWRVHPERASRPGATVYRSIEHLPAPPDATFIAVPNRLVPGIAAALAAAGAGGFVCFAAGFSETATEQGLRLTEQLIVSAGQLPFLGPNCYGFINFFDGAALWPDQLVGARQPRGVAIICQSGTIALDLLFNQRSLPIGYVITVGNQSCLAVEDLLELLSEDERVSAFGLYIEGIKDAPRFARAVARARAAGKPIAVIKAGRTAAAARTVHSHTGALAGADAVFDAFCRQAGVARCDSLATLCETLKLLHSGGPLRGRRVLLMGASGGDMAMTADASRHLGLQFPPIPADVSARLRDMLSDRVSIANPFDFNTHAWFDYPLLRSMFSAVHAAGFDAVGFMLDCPPEPQADATAYVAVIDEFLASHAGTDGRAAIIASLPESLSAATREKCLAAGVAPLQGQREALEALDLAGRIGEAWQHAGGVRLRLALPAQPAAGGRAPRSLPEHEGKAALAAFGVRIPASRIVQVASAGELDEAVRLAAQAIGFPVAIKAIASGLEHKSDVGAVRLDIRNAAQAAQAARSLSALGDRLLIEAMVTDGVAEILLGVCVDAQFGQLLVLGAGGVLTEMLRDSCSLLPPFSAAAIEAAIQQLNVGRLLSGYRGRPRGDVAALIEAALACARYAEAHLDSLLELEINPLIVRPAGLGAIAVDALIRHADRRPTTGAI